MSSTGTGTRRRRSSGGIRYYCCVESTFFEPSPHDLAEAARAASLAAEQAVVDLLHDVLDPAVVDEPAIRDHCQRFGPFSPSGCEEAITPLIERGLTDQHISVYLEAIVRLHRQGDRP